MAYVELVHTQAHGTLTGTSPGIDTTGVDLIVVSVDGGTGTTPTLDDNYLNTWVPLTPQSDSTTLTVLTLYYAQAPTVGAGHQFTVNGNGVSCYVECFSGSTVSPFDKENGTHQSAGATIQPGSVTPSEGNELVVCGVEGLINAPTIDSSFIVNESAANVSGVNYAGGIAYKIQTSAGAENPTWTEDTLASNTAIATFKAAATGGVPWVPPQQRIDNLMYQIKMIKTDR